MHTRNAVTSRERRIAEWTRRFGAAAFVAAVALTTLTVASCSDSPTEPKPPVGTLIGPEGGTVTVEDVTLLIPAGVLTKKTDIVIENVTDGSYAKSDPQDSEASAITVGDVFIDGTAHVIKPIGLLLNGTGATLTIRYAEAALPPGYAPQRLAIHERDAQQWRRMAQNQVRVQERAVEAVITRLGTYGIAGPDPDKMQVATVEVTPTTLTLALDETGQLEATAYCEFEQPLDRVFTWTTSAEAVATVSDAGLVTGVGEGTATITAEVDGVSATAEVTVSGTVASVVVTPATFSVSEGATQQLAAQALDANGNVLVRTFAWSSGNETVATVDANGLVQALLPGTATITATADGVNGTSVATVTAIIANIVVTPATFDLVAGEEVELTAVAYDPRGAVVETDFVWSSSNTSIATVDQTGKVTGVNNGNVTISAAAGGKQGGSGGAVRRVLSVVVTSPTDEPLGVGLTRQLTATAYDANGNVVNARFIWESNAVSIATVNTTGLVTAVAQGTVTISASVQTGASGSVQIKVIPGGGGGETEDFGNNLSWPLVFAEGIGITGSPVATDPGVRPAVGTDAHTELLTIPVTNPAAEFFFTGNVADVLTYFLQGTANAWRAQIVDGTSQPKYDASAYWGDNIAGGSASLKAGRPIRVEMALSTTDGVTLLGYNMPYVVNPSSPDEIQGTDGTTNALVPLIYSAGPTLTIEQLSGPGGTVIATVSSALFSSEVNVGGRAIYGAQFRPSVAGTYRLTFALATGANVRLIETNAGTVGTTQAAIEVTVNP